MPYMTSSQSVTDGISLTVSKSKLVYSSLVFCWQYEQCVTWSVDAASWTETVFNCVSCNSDGGEADRRRNRAHMQSPLLASVSVSTVVIYVKFISVQLRCKRIQFYLMHKHWQISVSVPEIWHSDAEYASTAWPLKNWIPKSNMADSRYFEKS